jgi:hypothetical protein
MKKPNKESVAKAERVRDILAGWISGYIAGNNGNCLELMPVQDAKRSLDELIFESGGKLDE